MHDLVLKLIATKKCIGTHKILQETSNPYFPHFSYMLCSFLCCDILFIVYWIYIKMRLSKRDIFRKLILDPVLSVSDSTGFYIRFSAVGPGTYSHIRIGQNWSKNFQIWVLRTHVKFLFRITLVAVWTIPEISQVKPTTTNNKFAQQHSQSKNTAPIYDLQARKSYFHKSGPDWDFCFKTGRKEGLWRGYVIHEWRISGRGAHQRQGSKYSSTIN